MKSLETLNKELNELNLEIRKLLLHKDSFREGLSDKIAVVITISTIRERIVNIQREIRQISDGDKY
jgi:hypothetical protein